MANRKFWFRKLLCSSSAPSLLLCLLATAASFCSCAWVPDPRPSHRVVIATWNVDNLFDEVYDGDEYPEFDPAHGWTRGQFWGRCEALARVIRTLGNPDVLVLEEVEGAHTAEVLNSRFLSDFGYRSTVMAPPRVPGVKTVIFSRYVPVRTGLHFPASDAAEQLRPIVEVEFELGGRSLVVLANHWKSRIPSPAATEGLRREAARVVSQRVQDLETRADHPLVVAVGDFNTSLELSRGWSDRAMVPGTVADGPGDGLVVFPSRGSAQRSLVPGAMWDPWELVSDPPGSYFYHGEWDRLDHTLVAASSLRVADWVVASFQAVAYAPRPVAFGPGSPQGISDHFPLVLVLERR